MTNSTRMQRSHPAERRRVVAQAAVEPRSAGLARGLVESQAVAFLAVKSSRKIFPLVAREVALVDTEMSSACCVDVTASRQTRSPVSRKHAGRNFVRTSKQVKRSSLYVKIPPTREQSSRH